jgi:hypothetical protein
MTDAGSVIDWLLNSDPSIRWQVLRDLPYWEGEIEECINGRTVADGAYFGVDVSSIVDRLVAERLADGGWNCERINGSVRSSFASTINVLEGLLEYERATGGTPESQKARKWGEEHLLERNLFRRLSTASRRTSDFCTSCTRTAGTTTSCVRSTISASPRSSPAPMPIRAWARRSTTFVADAWRTAPGRSTGARQGGCGSSSTTARANPRAG